MYHFRYRAGVTEYIPGTLFEVCTFTHQGLAIWIWRSYKIKVNVIN